MENPTKVDDFGVIFPLVFRKPPKISRKTYFRKPGWFINFIMENPIKVDNFGVSL